MKTYKNTFLSVLYFNHIFYLFCVQKINENNFWSLKQLKGINNERKMDLDAFSLIQGQENMEVTC